MFRNQYDHDVTVWSPQGRIHQIEYAMEAVKQGSATVGLKNNEFAVLIALKRAPSELSSYQEKIGKIDEHIGCSIAGLTADGRSLTDYMRNLCLNHRFTNDSPLPIGRLVSKLAYKMQIPTQKYGSRPFGVGVLLGGFDETGPHIYYQCPSAKYYDCKAMAIGSRSQSARTYLEKNMDVMKTCTLTDLITHGLQALNDTLPNDVQLNSKNCTVAIVGKNAKFEIIDGEKLSEHLKSVVIQRGRDQPAETPAVDPIAADATPTAITTTAEPMDQDQGNL